MNDVLQFVVDNKEMIISAAGAVIGVVSAISAKVTSSRTKRLIKDRLKGHYIICPHCKKMVDLDKEVHFYLPDGLKDDDLDGKEDED